MSKEETKAGSCEVPPVPRSSETGGVPVYPYLVKQLERHNTRLSALEEEVIRVDERTKRNSESLNILHGDIRSLRESVVSNHAELSGGIKDAANSLSQIHGGLHTLRWIALGLGALLTIVLIWEKIA